MILIGIKGGSVTLNISVLLQFTKLNIVNPDAFLLFPSLKLMAGKLYFEQQKMQRIKDDLEEYFAEFFADD